MGNLYDIVKGFKQYHRVVVTGPQRSGTQIASKIIADILDWEQVGEQKLCRKGFEHDERYFNWVSNPERQSTVLQCPRISHACHLTPKPTLVVFMMRDVGEILASDKNRMDKGFTRRSAKTFMTAPCHSVFETKRNQYSNLFYNRKPISIEETPQVVYDIWNSHQKTFDFNYYELDYNLLEQHPLWLPLEVRRRNFTTGTQTE